MTKSLPRTLTVSIALQLLAALNSWGCSTDLTITNVYDAAGDTFQVTALSSGGFLTGSFSGAQTHAFLYNNGVITDLGTLGGDESGGNAINAYGQVAGSSLLADSSTHAFLYSSGQLRDLGTLGGDFSNPAFINDAGQVVGHSLDADELDTLAFLYSDGAMVNLGTLGGTYSSAFCINNLGVVCGEASILSEDTHGFIYSAGIMTDVGTLGGTSSSCATLNDAGIAVGASSLANGNTHAFSYSAGTITDLGTLGGAFSSASFINKAGQILGLSSTANQQSHGFVFSGGVMIDIGTLGGPSSQGLALNNHGQVVGQSVTATGRSHAFLWQNGSMTDLNSLLPANSGWELLSARLLNDNRRIVGFGLYFGAFQWFVMDLPDHPPVANPGPDQTLDCQASVTLDGSLSSDPDGDTLAFQWSSSNIVLGTNSTLSTSFPLGTNVVTLTVTDPCGLSSQSNVNIIVVDSTPPVISCPISLSAPSDANCQAVVPDVVSQVVVSDNCTPPGSVLVAQNPLAGVPVGLGTYPIAVTASDLSGNMAGCTVLFTVVDQTPPLILSAPGLITLAANSNCQAPVPSVLNQILATDNCTPTNQLTMSQNPAPGTLLGTGQYAIAVSVTDASGNASSTNVPLVIVDTTPPTILSSPAAITVSVSTNCQGIVPNVLSNVLATDGCTPASQLVMSQNPPPGAFLPRGQSTITVSVTDASGNIASTSVLVTIADTAPPVIICPPDVVLPCGGSTDPSNTGTATATDNCDQPVIVFSDSSIDNCPASPTQITRTWTATDSAGNSSSCSQSIYVQCCSTNCPPVSSAIKANFNATPISTNNYIWFNANFSAAGIPPTGATVTFNNSVITITSPRGNFTFAVPDGTIVFNPSVSCATTTFNSSGWVTTVPVPPNNEILLSALGVKAPANLQAASVTWSGYFSANTHGVAISWKWGAAVYNQDMTQPQYNTLGVKATHDKACLCQNPDHAGTPENMKSYLVPGARGGGGSNWTGSWSGTGNAKLCK